MGFGDRLVGAILRIRESDEQRLAEEIEGWAAAIPDTLRIAAAPVREQVRIAGVVRRMTVRPAEGNETLEVLVDDGTGEAVVVWTGRRAIPGLTLGTGIIAEGMLAEQLGERRVINPRFEFAPPID
ncbi:MAG: DNA-binding protein [Actinomycetota bacterium]